MANARKTPRSAATPGQPALNGIDLVTVDPVSRKTLSVHFVNELPLKGTVTSAVVTRGDAIVASLTIDDSADWSLDANTPRRPVLTLATTMVGDASRYKLILASSLLAPPKNQAQFFFMEPRDRLQALLQNAEFNGIDFVEVGAIDPQTQKQTLRVRFLNAVPVKGTKPAVTITGGERVATVAVDKIDDSNWSSDSDHRPLLTLKAAAPADFSFYTFALTSSALDPYFSRAQFSFKAECPSDLDCAEPVSDCPVLKVDAPPIDYLAKDFLSFRKALSDFSALRYREWVERSEADFGVMFMEALAALADDLSYTQDRVALEATLDTAAQRRSIVRHARLVDYEPRPAIAASVILRFAVAPGTTQIKRGVLVSAQLPEQAPIYFETGTLVNPTSGKNSAAMYLVNALWNNIQPYWWDDTQRCLMAGATEMWVIDVQGGLGLYFGQQLLIETVSDDPTIAPVREIATIARFDAQQDKLFGPSPTSLVHIVFATPLQFNHDLTLTTLSGNLVSATQGRTMASEMFAIDAGDAQIPPAVVRTGANGTTQYLYTLKNAPLAFLANDDASAPPVPELLLVQNSPKDQRWTWRRTLVDALPFEQSFTLDPAVYSSTARDFASAPVQDYDGDAGTTVRFGDGVFGDAPQSGDRFTATYRVGGGAVGNVAADSIAKIESVAPGGLISVTNPFAAAGGKDAETNQQVKRLAPQAFRAVQYRAVRPEDYVAAVETLPWTLRAGAVFRWTGSWLTVFATANPKGSETITTAEQLQLINLLNRYRMAGYEAYAPAPRYVGLDLYVEVCARPSAFRGDVEAGILKALSSRVFGDGTAGFFYTDNFSFGTPLERSGLEAAIQNVVGVAGVTSIKHRRRGVTLVPVEMDDAVPVAPDEIIRVDNDPSRPERGSLRVEVHGGK